MFEAKFDFGLYLEIRMSTEVHVHGTIRYVELWSEVLTTTPRPCDSNSKCWCSDGVSFASREIALLVGIHRTHTYGESERIGPENADTDTYCSRDE